MANRKKNTDVFRFVFRHVKGAVLINDGFKTDDFGQPLLPHRLYAYETNRTAHKIYLNPKVKNGS